MSYVQLTPRERCVIFHMRLYGLGVREIARRLGRHPSTIGRELRRNRPRPSGVYWHQEAQRLALQRRRRPCHRRRHAHASLVRYVAQSLGAARSPEVIAARLPLEYPDDPRMRVSVETVYRWVYRDARHGGALFRCLCRRHPKRRRQRRYGTGRGLIPGRVGIAQRPALVAARQRFGDWEGDTLEGAKGCGGLTTHVERESRYLIAAKLPDKTAQATATAVTTAFRHVPPVLRHTLTLDNGKEFARFKDIEAATGLAIYFADPYAAWQRGTNENTNGRLRRYFPKGSNFRNVSRARLASVVKKLNHLPRKCLDYRTPHEVFLEALHGAVGK